MYGIYVSGLDTSKPRELFADLFAGRLIIVPPNPRFDLEGR
jgi:hypothetical protein